MVILETIVVACSLFSALPMPQIQWSERNMRYALWAFPLVGAVIGGLCWLWVRLCALLGAPDLLRGAGLCLLPVLVTGGIHLDGYADTWDALSSWGEPARRREILKDPHLGAFAAIRLCGYFVADFALWTCLPVYRAGGILCLFCLSRTLSGLALTAFPLAEGSGLARSFAQAADKRRVRNGLAALAALLCGGLVLLGCWTAAVAALGVFWYYRRVTVRKFQGLSGDLAGWFLQTAELWMLGALCAQEFVEKLL
jgi:adenosylcobinamide-GDP ribazoletransferase